MFPICMFMNLHPLWKHMFRLTIFTSFLVLDSLRKRQNDNVIWKKEQAHFRHNLLINDNNNKLWWNNHEHICFDNSCWLIESNSYTHVNEKQHLHLCLWYSKGKVIYHIKSSSKSHLPWTKHNESSIKALKASIHVHNKLRLRWPIRTYNTSHPVDIVSEVNVEHRYRIQHQINS